MNIPQESLDKFAKIGITTDHIKAFIDEGRQKGLPDSDIADALKRNYEAKYAESGLGRGQNIGGALRKVASEIPYVGTWMDDTEADIRAEHAMLPDVRKALSELTPEKKQYYRENPRELGTLTRDIYNTNYDKYYRNAKESLAGANRVLQEGNWLDRNAGLMLGMSMNAIPASLTGGATLMPGVSGIQGAIEGAGAGEGIAQRAILGGAGGAVGWVVPAVFNKIIPTQSVQNRTIKKYITPTKEAITPFDTKGGNMLTSLATKAMSEGKLPEQVLAENMTRATKRTIQEGLKKGAYANARVAKPVFESAVRNVNTPYVDYMTQAVKSASPKYATKLGNELAKIGLESGDDVLIYGDVRPQVVDAINTAMRGASKQAKEEVSNAAQKAIGERASAKILNNILTPKSYGSPNFRLNIPSLFSKYISNPILSIGNRGTVNTLTGRTLLDDTSRGAVDTIIERIIGPKR